MVLTGTSMNRGESAGKLVFLDKTSFERVCEMEIGKSHAIRALWHPKLNQMIVGSGDGVVRMYYDPERSLNGAKLCVVKTKTKAKTTHYVATQHIITPYSLPMFRFVNFNICTYKGFPTVTRILKKGYEKWAKISRFGPKPGKYLI